MVGQNISPLISHLRDSFPPRGSLLCRVLYPKYDSCFFSIQVVLKNEKRLDKRLPLGGKLSR